MTQYVALLRGINVGGNNLIKMAELARCFEKQGFSGVTTYIQSGNVLFEAGAASPSKLARGLEAAILKTFDCKAAVALRSKKELKSIVTGAPKGFGKQPEKYRYDVIFLFEPLAAKEALKDMPIREGVDQAFAGNGVLYASRLIAKATKSKISKIASMPMYKQMTIRNWNTTTKLLSLMEAVVPLARDRQLRKG
jgi:uncharacterized protein (DUF1697 family)